MRENESDPAIVGNRFAEEPAPFGGQGVGRANELHPQGRVVPEFPEHPATHLHTLAVVPREFDQRFAMRGQKRLQFSVDGGLAERPAERVGEAELDERIR